jgi:outer membrane protein
MSEFRVLARIVASSLWALFVAQPVCAQQPAPVAAQPQPLPLPVPPTPATPDAPTGSPPLPERLRASVSAAGAEASTAGPDVPDVRASPSASRGLSVLDVMQTALRAHPSIRLAKDDLSARRAELSAAQGPFDPLLLAEMEHRRETYPVLPAFALDTPGYDTDVADTTHLNLGASWLSRWGMTVEPSVSMSRIHRRPGGSVDVSGVPGDPYHQASVNLTVSQALLRGAGTVGAASGIGVALLNREAAEHLVAHAAQQQVFRAIAAYWQYVAAFRIVQMFLETEQGARGLVEDTAQLVKADERPASDLRQLEGNLASRTRAVHDARNDEMQALYALYEAMGLGVRDAAPSVPIDDFPAPRGPTPSAQEAIAQARTLRQDLHALKRSVASAEVALEGAERNTLPALDLSVSVGYDGAIDDDGVGAFFSAVGSNVRGANAGMALSLELPVRNTARAAERDAKSAARSRARTALQDFERRLGLDVLTSWNDLRFSAAAFEASTRAVEQFRKALDNERERLHEGIGTVVDVVFAQDELNRAQQDQTLDHARYAIAAARLRFEMGALPDNEHDVLRAATQILGRGSASGSR